MTQIPDILKAMAEAMACNLETTSQESRIFIRSADRALHAFAEMMPDVTHKTRDTLKFLAKIRQWHKQNRIERSDDLSPL